MTAQNPRPRFAPVPLRRDDDQGLGGEDDSVYLVIFVEYLSGDACGEAATWTLQVAGHTAI